MKFYCDQILWTIQSSLDSYVIALWDLKLFLSKVKTMIFFYITHHNIRRFVMYLIWGLLYQLCCQCTGQPIVFFHQTLQFHFSLHTRSSWKAFYVSSDHKCLLFAYKIIIHPTISTQRNNLLFSLKFLPCYLWIIKVIVNVTRICLKLMWIANQMNQVKDINYCRVFWSNKQATPSKVLLFKTYNFTSQVGNRFYAELQRKF